MSSNCTIDHLLNRDKIGEEEVLLNIEEEDGIVKTYNLTNFECVKEAELVDDMFVIHHFLEYLKEDVTIVNIPTYALARFYSDNIFPRFKEKQIMAWITFVYRLGYDTVPQDTHMLRCRVNCNILKFLPETENMFDLNRLGNSKYFLVLQLWVEEGMVDLSLCDFVGTGMEIVLMVIYRFNDWPRGFSYAFHLWAGSLQKQMDRLCPLKPGEIEIMRRAVGYPKDTRIYVASGHVYTLYEHSFMFTFVDLYVKVTALHSNPSREVFNAKRPPLTVKETEDDETRERETVEVKESIWTMKDKSMQVCVEGDETPPQNFEFSPVCSGYTLIPIELVDPIAEDYLGDEVSSRIKGKLDMEKAYDRMQWPFLLNVLKRMGFSDKWIQLIDHCISPCWFSVLINGCPAGFFKSTRGLRQGDPISPTLFILAAEYLSKLLDQLILGKKEMMYRTARYTMGVSHLAYADDIIVFSQAQRSAVLSISDCLEHYMNVSGQKVNVGKSCFFLDERHNTWATEISELSICFSFIQIVIWSILPAIRSSHADHTNNALVLIVLLQYIPRLYLIFPLSSEIIKANGLVTKTAWAGAAYNLVLYMLASHVLGASWYLLSIERHATCLKSACRDEFNGIGCSLPFLDCGTLTHNDRGRWVNSTQVFKKCNPDDTTYFKYGIFGNAIANSVVSSGFREKYFYCLWWGLQNLSSYGQTLSTSTFIGETMFAILIAILGLVLFAHLIGNMQTYLQSMTVRLEEWRLRRRDTEEWMRHRQLPEALQQRVRRFIQYKWLTTRGVDEESILHALPIDLRRDIKRHLCLDLVRRVPFFSQMDDQLLDAICERLVSSLSTQGTYIVREGDPVSEMLFIIRGVLESSTTNGGRTGFFNSTTLRPGDFCGEELLAWALLPRSTLNFPSSTRTVRALNEVEAFVLRAEDLKFVANQFRRLHSKKLQHTFRYYSHHWRTWAACFIQAAWRRCKKRMMAKNLSVSESFCFSHDVQSSEEHDGEEEDVQAAAAADNSCQVQQNPASRFAANTKRGAQKANDLEMHKLQKPEEPDFSADADVDE
ncbi:probable cyclic nucleotide-gated ion channel 14 [Salvia hispanica]|uniref:probable cyclic nucleotide-gated ion channel 14 n=1 Tax=Salvia hispanica TaxID=49212 RepID=UPI00200970EE|nr:probable cyclic nucleotide-gated ion channel 14 [Salvia hispanica]